MKPLILPALLLGALAAQAQRPVLGLRAGISRSNYVSPITKYAVVTGGAAGLTGTRPWPCRRSCCM